jgi:hypothetical protein
MHSCRESWKDMQAMWQIHENTENDSDQWLEGLVAVLLEYAEQYPDFHVVTHFVYFGESDDIPADTRTRSPLLDLCTDDRAVRFVTLGLRKQPIRDIEPAEPLRLPNVALRLQRFAGEGIDYGPAFVEPLTPTDGLGLCFVMPLKGMGICINEEEKLLCIMGLAPPPGRWHVLSFLKTSIERIWVGLRRSYLDD